MMDIQDADVKRLIVALAQALLRALEKDDSYRIPTPHLFDLYERLSNMVKDYDKLLRDHSFLAWPRLDTSSVQGIRASCHAVLLYLDSVSTRGEGAREPLEVDNENAG